MNKFLLTAAALTAAIAVQAQSITYPLQGAGSEWPNGALTVSSGFAAGAEGAIFGDAFQEGNGLLKTVKEVEGVRYFSLAPKADGITTYEAAQTAGQTYKNSLMPRSGGEGAPVYYYASVEFDVAVSSADVKLAFDYNYFSWTDLAFMKTANLITDDTWAALPKDGTFQTVRVSFPLDAQQAKEVDAMGSFTFTIFNASTLDYVLLRNVKFNLTTTLDGQTAITSLSAAGAENAPLYDLKGQPVGRGHKGLVVRNGRKFLQN